MFLRIAFGLSFLTAGCAVNQTGLVDVRHYENSTVHLITKEAWGVYLSTAACDAGLVIGHIHRYYLYPGKNEEVGLSVNEMLDMLQHDDFVESISEFVDDLNDEDQPYVISTNDQGLLIHANAIKAGLTLGIDDRDVIQLPIDFNGAFAVSKRPGKINAYFFKQFKNQ